MDSKPHLNQLFEHRDFVRSVARRLGRDESMGDDLEQDVWVEVLQSPPINDSGLRTWFRSVLRSSSSQRIRDDRRWDERHQNFATVQNESSEVSERDFDELRVRLRNALSALPESDQEILRLRYFEDSSSADIAHHLRLSPDTVRARQRRALLKMRQDLERQTGRDRERWLPGLAFGLRWPEWKGSAALSLKPLGALLILLLPVALYFGITRWEKQPQVLAGMSPLGGQGESTEHRSELSIPGGETDGVPTPVSLIETEALALGSDSGSSSVTAETVDVDVFLLDRIGRPCVGATLLISGPDDLEPRIVAGVTDETGRCSLKALKVGRWLAARSREFNTRAVILERPISGTTGALRLDLKLPRAVQQVAGTVLDPFNRPLPGAVVSLGREERFPATRDRAGQLGMPPLVTARTDEKGEFKLRHNWHRSVPLEVQHGSFATTRILLSPDDEQVPPINMSPGGALSGTILDSNLHGVPRANVSLRHAYLGRLAETRSGGAGGYQFERIPAGTYLLTVVTEVDGGPRCAEQEIEVLEHDELHADLVLQLGAGIAGDVLGLDHQPLAGWWVAAFDHSAAEFAHLGEYEFSQPSPTWAQVDSTGNFQLNGCRADQYQLRLYRTKDFSSHPVARLDDVVPGTESQQLHLGPLTSDSCTSSLLVRPLETDGLDEYELWVTSSWCPQPLRGTLNDEGHHIFQGLGAGPLKIWYAKRGSAPRVAAHTGLFAGMRSEHSLEPWPGPGFIDLAVFGESPNGPRRLKFMVGAIGQRVRAFMVKRGGKENGLRVDGDSHLTGQLAPGEYMVSVLAPGAMAHCRVSIRSGETYRGEVTLMRAVPHAIHISLPPPRHPDTAHTGELWIDLSNPAGELMFTIPAVELSASRRSFSRHQGVPVGTWSAHVFVRRFGVIEAEAFATWIVGEGGGSEETYLELLPTDF